MRSTGPSKTKTALTRRQLGAAALSFAAVMAVGPAFAARPIGFDGWQSWTFRGIPPTGFSFQGNTVTINADQSASVVYGLVPADARQATRASWQWQVAEGVGPTNLAARGGDDRAIALYFVFVSPDVAAGYSERTPPMSRLLSLRDARTLIYVWGGNASRGTVLDSPYLRGRGKTVILQPAGSGSWKTENVNLAADHRRAFGSDAQTLIAVGVSSDSDDTGAINRAGLRGLTLS
ncbi:MAG: DUF3047 domain-containing protein [Cohaesibacteraceae bacterium]